MMVYCVYYQVQVVKREAWFFTAVLRSYEHLAFDRTLDKEKSIFEVFVPACLEQYFLALLEQFKEMAIISDFNKLDNRLLDPEEQV